MDEHREGTGALFAAHTSARVVDFLYRILIVRAAGAAAVGALGVIGSLYGLLVTVASAGIPAAVTNLTAEKTARGDRAGLERTLSLSFLITGGLGVLLGAGLMATSRPAARLLFHDPSLHLPILALAPAVAIVPVSGVYRAYLQGRYFTYPTARARLVEALAQTAFGLSALTLAGPLPLAAATTILACAITGGEAAGLLSVYASFQRVHAQPSPVRREGVARRAGARAPLRKEQLPGSNAHAARLRDDLGTMARFAWASTSVRLVAMASGAISAAMIPALLRAAGHAPDRALALYGQFGGMAAQIAFFPATLVWAFTFNLTPGLSACRSRGDTRSAPRLVEDSLYQAWMLALPAAACTFLLAEPLCRFAFGTGEPALLLIILSAVAPLVTVDQVMTASLHGWSEPGLAFRNFAVGEVINLGLTYLLVPRLGLPGAAVAIGAGTLIEALWDWQTVARLLGRPPSLRRPAARAGLPAALSGLAAYLAHRAAVPTLGNAAATLLALATATLVVVALVRLARDTRRRP
ncbi:MAG: oligosaccharide flippase family protein [Bacillota bacterium]|nr:oligosaccharide flippase family protein [Bacillota bacterium]